MLSIIFLENTFRSTKDLTTSKCKVHTRHTCGRLHLWFFKRSRSNQFLGALQEFYIWPLKKIRNESARSLYAMGLFVDAHDFLCSIYQRVISSMIATKISMNIYIQQYITYIHLYTTVPLDSFAANPTMTDMLLRLCLQLVQRLQESKLKSLCHRLQDRR